MIPRIIHQIWFQFGENGLPTPSIKNQHNAHEIIKDNPNWEYVLWNRTLVEKFISAQYPKYYNVYNDLQFDIQKVDFARYVILYHYGGIYLDFDVKLNKSLLNLTYDVGRTCHVQLAKGNMINQVENQIMASLKNEPFWIDVINTVDKNNKIPKKNYELFYLYVFRTSGAKSVKEVYQKYRDIVCIIDNGYSHEKDSAWHNFPVIAQQLTVYVAVAFAVFALYKSTKYLFKNNNRNKKVSMEKYNKYSSDYVNNYNINNNNNNNISNKMTENSGIFL